MQLFAIIICNYYYLQLLFAIILCNYYYYFNYYLQLFQLLFAIISIIICNYFNYYLQLLFAIICNYYYYYMQLLLFAIIIIVIIVIIRLPHEAHGDGQLKQKAPQETTPTKFLHLFLVGKWGWLWWGVEVLVSLGCGG